MKNLSKILIMACLVLWENMAWANLYKVTNVPVVAERSSALEAKEAALAEGQMEAFKRLLARLSPQGEAQLPQITEETVLPYVAGVSIETEKTTATKYMGSIAVEFNPKAVKELLNTQQVTYLKTQAPTLLVIPEYITNGRTQILEDTSPLYQALQEKKELAPFYQAVLPKGTEEELALVRQDMGNVSALLSNYGKERLMVLRFVQEGEDMWRVESDFYPMTGMQNQIIQKRFRFANGDLKLALGQMADAMFKEMENRWRADRTTSLSDKQVLYLRVSVQSLSDWLRLEKEMKTWNFLEETALKGLYLPQVLVEATYKGSEDDLVDKLLGQGWRLNKDFSGNGATLTRIGTYE